MLGCDELGGDNFNKSDKIFESDILSGLHEVLQGNKVDNWGELRDSLKMKLIEKWWAEIEDRMLSNLSYSYDHTSNGDVKTFHNIVPLPAGLNEVNTFIKSKIPGLFLKDSDNFEFHPYYFLNKSSELYISDDSSESIIKQLLSEGKFDLEHNGYGYFTDVRANTYYEHCPDSYKKLLELFILELEKDFVKVKKIVKRAISKFIDIEYRHGMSKIGIRDFGFLFTEFGTSQKVKQLVRKTRDTMHVEALRNSHVSMNALSDRWGAYPWTYDCFENLVRDYYALKFPRFRVSVQNGITINLR